MVAALRSSDPLRLGPYDIEGRLGEGGQGVVYLGRHSDGGQEFAIKLLHLESDDKARARFLREVEVAKKVAPFCTARLYDVGADGEQFYTVSEYVPGPSLQARVQEDGPLAGSELERLAVGTATALVSIHQAGIIHRDFKPHNVLLGPDGPRVIDFGVAKATSASTTLTSKVIGTPSYMSPEQVEADEVGPASDVFCWASTMVYAATGNPPFGQDSIMAVINRIANHEPDLGGLEGPLRELILDCLDKDPAARPRTRDLLMRLLGHAEAVPGGMPAAVPPGGTTAVLSVGAGLADGAVADPNRTSLDPAAGVKGVSPQEWARRNGNDLPPAATVTGTHPRREARARRAAKVPWFITAAAVSFAVFTAGGAGFVVYKISGAAESVSPGPSRGDNPAQVEDRRKRSSEAAPDAVPTTTGSDGKPTTITTTVSPSRSSGSPKPGETETKGPRPSNTSKDPDRPPVDPPPTKDPDPTPTIPPPDTGDPDPDPTPTTTPVDPTTPPVIVP
jgi:serine/threonine protein kinase